jgi:hypothetical protein
MHNVPTILALDASSTMIGYVVYAGRVLAHGEHKLAGGDIATRCQTAYDILVLLISASRRSMPSRSRVQWPGSPRQSSRRRG